MLAPAETDGFLRRSSRAAAAPPPAAGGDPPAPASTDAGAAPLERIKREQAVLDYLNRGLSMVEIAARVGVGEKRMRAVVREILARRAPPRPDEFVAIQVNRLNEALLFAFDAMAEGNLRSIDRVVSIVRALDRYHGVDVGRLRHGRLPREAAPAVLGGALVCSATVTFALPPSAPEPPADALAGDVLVRASEDEIGEPGANRPRIGLQASENTRFAPGFAPGCANLSDLRPAEAASNRLADSASAGSAVHEIRPETVSQVVEKPRFAPGNAGASSDRRATTEPFRAEQRHQHEIGAAAVGQAVGLAQDAVAGEAELFVGALGARVARETVEAEAEGAERSEGLVDHPGQEGGPDAGSGRVDGDPFEIEVAVRVGDAGEDREGDRRAVGADRDPIGEARRREHRAMFRRFRAPDEGLESRGPFDAHDAREVFGPGRTNHETRFRGERRGFDARF